MKTTLSIIKNNRPCKLGWEILLKSLNKTKSDDEDLELMHILKSNGIKDAIWCLRCFKYKDYCLFLADVAESAIGIYEDKFDSEAPRKAIEAIREYKKGDITKERLKVFAAYAAYAADAAAADAAADTAYAAAADAAAYAADAADAAAYAAAAADAAAYAAYAAADAAAGDAAAGDAAYAYAKGIKWAEIEVLFIKHFGDNNLK